MRAPRLRRVVPGVGVLALAVSLGGPLPAPGAVRVASVSALPPVGGVVPIGGPGPSPADCSGPLDPSGLPRRPGPRLRFGISPGVTAGQVGAPQPAKGQDMNRALDALGRLRFGHAPFVLRLTRLFWSDGEAGIAQNLALARRYTDAGFQVELQLRYRPPTTGVTDLPGWLAFVREVVDRYGGDRGVVGLQVTNEVNFTTSPDSSDGAYPSARDALIQGVEAAKREATRLRDDQLRIGFNWFYRADPSTDQSFWTYLAQHGGADFAAAVDWVGLDAYPGTFFPPSEPSGGFADGVVNALSVLRNCYMPMGGLGAAIPIQVEENGYPTGPGRSEQTQAEALREMVQAVSDLRGTFNVSDYRWFDLRDADSSSSNFQQQFGLLHDDYSPKPAFDVFRTLISTLGPPGAPAARSRGRSHRLRLHLMLRDAHGRALRAGACVRGAVILTWSGPDAGRLRRVSVSVDGRRLRVRVRRRSAPIPRARLRGRRRHHLRFVAGDGQAVLRASLTLRRCPPPADLV